MEGRGGAELAADELRLALSHLIAALVVGRRAHVVRKDAGAVLLMPTEGQGPVWSGGGHEAHGGGGARGGGHLQEGAQPGFGRRSVLPDSVPTRRDHLAASGEAQVAGRGWKVEPGEDGRGRVAGVRARLLYHLGRRPAADRGGRASEHCGVVGVCYGDEASARTGAAQLEGPPLAVGAQERSDLALDPVLVAGGSSELGRMGEA